METFEAIIKQHEGINGAYVEVPFDVQDVFGGKRVKVIATFDGYEYRGSIVFMGSCYLIGITQEIRKAISKSFGDSVLVTVSKDNEERKVEIADDFKEILEKNNIAHQFWTTLSFSSQKKYMDWINSAKKSETRQNRIQEAIIMLKDHKKIK